MAAGALCFAVMAALVKSAGSRLPTMEIVLARSLVVLAISGWSLLARGESPWGNERGLLLLRGGLGFVGLTCSYWAVIHLPLAEATVIQYTNPVLTALLASFAIGETLRAAEVLLAVASLCGVALVARPPLFPGTGTGLDPFTVGVALTGALFSAAAYVTVRRLRSEEPLVVVFYFALVSTVAALPGAAATFVPPRGVEGVVLVAVGVSTHLGQLFLTRGLRTERAGRATAVGYLQIVFAAALGLVFFGEVPDGWTAAGALVIVLCTLAVARTRPRAVRVAVEEP